MTLPLPPTEYRCPDCVQGRSWASDVVYCPLHGKSVRPYVVVRMCECGYVPPHEYYRFCAKCGKPLPEVKS